MLEELERSLPIAMLFLKRLRAIDLRRAGQPALTFERLDDHDSLILSDGRRENDRVWHLVRGDFTEVAEKLRQQHPGLIEPKRSSQVTLAIPSSELRAGLLCAWLPTEHDVGLPFHINADFFPTNDRKQVILAEDYQSDWNRAALLAAARAVGQAVGRLPALVGAQRFWDLVSTLKEVADRVGNGHGEPSLSQFWKEAAPQLRTTPVIHTTRGEWTTAADACLLLQREEASAIGLLEALGVQVVHEDLRAYQSLLRSEAVGVPILDVGHICKALAALGLERRTQLGDLPPALGTASGRAVLWVEIALLLERQGRFPRIKAEDERRLRTMALAPGRDGALWPCHETYSADEAAVALFEPLALDIPFVARDSSFEPLVYLCTPFGAIAAVEALGRAGAGHLESLWKCGQLSLRRLFAWLQDRRQEILADPRLKDRLRSLPLFPSVGKLRALGKLALPGNFTDPLGLAELVDLAELGGRPDFLRDLGMRELDFRTYAVEFLPAALKDPSATPDKRRAAVRLLADHVGELRDDPQARQALAATPLVECTDGEFRRVGQCYFDTSTVRDCLGDNTHFAALPTEHGAAVSDLYAWLGVRHEPRPEDIVSKVRELSGQPYSRVAVLQIQKILAHLGKRFEPGGHPVELHFLQSAKWLPACGKADRWYRPDELHAIYQDYLFESQALFLDLPRDVQNTSRDILDCLGIHLTPAPHLVVAHLVHCATNQIPMKAEVYRFLNENAGHPALNHLKDKKCLWLGDAYRAPTEVFWGEHPFRRYRWRLGEELRGYSNLLKRLEVRDTPDHHDALSVLKEISSAFGSANTPLDQDTDSVVMACWQMLQWALDVGALSADGLQPLRSVKCVANAGRVLYPPEWMFFENRAGLAAKFGEFPSNNVIPHPLGAGKALAVAGVRQLGSAVQVELLECADPTDDSAMGERMRARRAEIARVLGSQNSGQRAAEALARLDNIRCMAATSLVIRYRLRAFGRQQDSKPEPVSAVYRTEEHALYFTQRGGHEPWPALARELAAALFPDEDPGRFAAGLKEVLAADTDAEAAAILDDLGFARLDTSVRELSWTSEAAAALGTDSGGEPVTADVVSGDTAPTGRPVGSPDEVIRQFPGPQAPPPMPPVLRTDQVGTRAASSAGRGPEPTRQKARPVLRSYVPSPETSDSTSPGRENEVDGESRSRIDQAGLRRVLEYETRCGRTPHEMPHQNPGYDVESCDAAGRVDRYIEVKSFSGLWTNTYAVLSRPQFDKANEVAESFWLYVVERAESDDFRIHRIQNPALKANHFMFDDGWRAIAEPEPPSEKGG